MQLGVIGVTMTDSSTGTKTVTRLPLRCVLMAAYFGAGMDLLINASRPLLNLASTTSASACVS